jgi:hypothetical protein
MLKQNEMDHVAVPTEADVAMAESAIQGLPPLSR